MSGGWAQHERVCDKNARPEPVEGDFYKNIRPRIKHGAGSELVEGTFTRTFALSLSKGTFTRTFAPASSTGQALSLSKGIAQWGNEVIFVSARIGPRLPAETLSNDHG